MGLDIWNIVNGAFTALYKNKAVLAFALAAALLSAVFSAFLGAQITSLRTIFGTFVPGTTISGFQNFLGIIGSIFSVFASAAVAFILVFLIGVFINGAIVTSAADGAKSDLSRSARNSASRYLTLLFTMIVTGILVGLGFILFVLPGIYLLLRFAAVYPECVVGRKGVFDSLKGSWNLTDGNVMSIFAILVVIFVVVIIVGVVFNYIFGHLHLRPVGSFVTTFIATAYTVANVLIYQGITASRSARRRKR